MRDALRPAGAQGSAGRHRPLLPVLSGFALGIALQELLATPPLVLALTSASAVIVSLLVLIKRPGNAAFALTAAMLFLPAGGLWLHQRYQSSPPFHIEHLLARRPGLLRVRARVTAPPRPLHPRHPFKHIYPGHGDRWIMTVQVTELQKNNMEWRRSRGGITVFGEGQTPEMFYGDIVGFMGDFRPNAPNTNPGEPAMDRIYRRSGNYGTAGGVCGETIELIRRNAWRRSPRSMAEMLRRRARRRLHHFQDRDGAVVHPLVWSLLLGDRHALTDTLESDLADAGAMHFLAISGLHVGIFAAGVWLLLSLISMEPGRRHMALIALIWIYVLFTGARISSIRAALMLSMLAGAPLVRRGADPLSTLAGAAFLILIWRPQELFSTGFHLTFTAVWAIFYLYPELRDTLLPWRRLEDRLRDPADISVRENLWIYGSDYFLLSLSIWLVTVPINAMVFNRYSLLLPLLSLALWPLVLFLILNCFLIIFFLPSGGQIFAVFNRSASLLSSGIENLLALSRNLPGFVRHTPGPPLWWVAFYYLILIVWIGATGKKRKIRVAVAGAMILTASILWYEISASRPDNFRMTVADTGHGQSIMLRLPEGGVMLCDAGSTSYSSLRGISGVLRHNRVRRIGVLLISHRHFDHFCFTPALSEHFGIGRLLIPPEGTDENVPRELNAILRDSAEEYIRVMEGTRISAGNMTGLIQHPNARFLAESGVRINDRSAVLMCEYLDWRILLPGDAEEEALKRLTADYGQELRADVLILPHHGAWADGLGRFLDAVQPSAAVASSGRPLNAEVRKLLQRRGIAVWSTYDDGAVTFDFKPDKMRIEGYLSGRTQLIARQFEWLCVASP